MKIFNKATYIVAIVLNIVIGALLAKAYPVQATFQEVDECQGECITYETENYCSKWFIVWCLDWDEREVCTEYENTCAEPEVTPTVTPIPTDSPKEDVEDGNFDDTRNNPIACVAQIPHLLPRDIKVDRNGSVATVSAVIPEGDKTNIYFKENSSATWTHAKGDVPVIVLADGQRGINDKVEALNPSLGYTFGIQATNACAGGEIVLAVVVDPPAFGQTFYFSYWEVLK